VNDRGCHPSSGGERQQEACLGQQSWVKYSTHKTATHLTTGSGIGHLAVHPRQIVFVIRKSFGLLAG
jgi:hypothetical protein